MGRLRAVMVAIAAAALVVSSGAVAANAQEAPPAWSVSDVTVTEGDAGVTLAWFTVSLDQAAGSLGCFQANTFDGTAVAPSDYESSSSGWCFEPGDTSLQVYVAVLGDTLDEPDESFTLELSDLTGATIADGQGVGTIVDDDDPPVLPALSVSDVSVVEDDAGGNAEALFTVSLDNAAATPVSVQVDTADGTASAASGDYGSGTGTVHFAPGETTQAVGIPVAPDTVDEPDETFTLELSNPSGATIADGQGVATIVDDDDPFVPPELTVGDVSVVEGDAGETPALFVVSLDHAVASPVTVQFNTDGETAGGTDFAPIGGLVVFEPGMTSREVAVPVFGDTIDEPDETFILELFDASGATIADGGPGGQGPDGRGVATIVNDDAVVPTSTEVTGAPNPSTVGNAVAITATVSDSTAGEPAGTVTFYDGPVSPANTLGTAALNASGIATLSTDDLAVGAHTINAVYNPDATHSGSAGSYTQTVNPAPPPKLLCVRVTVFGLSIRICI